MRKRLGEWELVKKEDLSQERWEIYLKISRNPR